MKIWYLWEGDINGDVPGTYEIKRLQEEGLKRGHEVRIVFPDQVKILVSGDAQQNIFVDGEPQSRPDVVMSRMGAASSYLSLAVLRHLLRNGVLVINRAASVELAIDKLRTMQVLADKNIPAPRTMFARCPVDAQLITEQIGYPVIVKTLKGTQGGGVYLSETPESLRDLSEILVHQGADTSPVLFQEYVKTSHGRDIRAFCVGGKVLACMERKSTDGSFKSNITRGGVGEPVEITPELSRIALDTCEALGLEIAGIDLLYTESGYKVCEANSAPDFKGLETYCHVDVPERVYGYIESRYAQEKGEKNSMLPTFIKKWVSGLKYAA